MTRPRCAECGQPHPRRALGLHKEQKVHDLKAWPKPFQAIWDGHKRFEYRLNDRNFQVWDTLRLLEWDPETKRCTGREIEAYVSHILRAPDFGMREGYVAMSLKVKRGRE